MLDFLGKIYKKRGGIWKYADFYFEKIERDNRLVLKDGSTPLVENKSLNKDLGAGHLYFKREDVNETGSLKGRSLAYQVSLNRQRRVPGLVISTSGNAGIAAAAYAKEAGMKIFVFISPDTEKVKVAHMQQYGPVIIRSRRAMRFANYAAARYKLPNLRPSIDDDSIEGFKSIAFEIAEEAGDVDAIFTFVTSGSSFIGMYRGFEAFKNKGRIGKIPKMYAVQSGKIFSIAQEFEDNSCLIGREEYEEDESIKAGQLGTKNTKRKKEILDIINRTGGKGVYVSDKEIGEARLILGDKDIETSPEGCASFAAFMKIQKKEKFESAVCILSGRLRSPDVEVDESVIWDAENFEDVDRIVQDKLSF